MIEPSKKNRPVVLVVLDGWGVAAPSHGNAITLAKTPFFNKAASFYFTTTLQASALPVGLPWGEGGNSEVGHLNLGAGKIIYQSLPKIDKSIVEKDFFQNEKFLQAIEHAKKNNSKLHLLGLVSRGGVHSSMDHLFALLKLCQDKKIEKVFIHAILDGRDSPYNSASQFINELEKKIKEFKIGKIATLIGRFYAMDRDNHWERIEKAYFAMTAGEGRASSSAVEAISNSYAEKNFDEEFLPTVIFEEKKPIARVEDNDSVIFFNFRPDRARELTKAFISEDVEKKFERKKKINNLFFVTMSEYEEGLPVEIAFLPEKIENPLARVISEQGLFQLHIAETEKYAHVTYFLNGGREKPFNNEDWILVPSPRVSSYDQKPEMSAKAITEKIILAINSDKYDFILVNFANPDMVSHTGNIEATIKAVEFLDSCLEQITEATLKRNGIIIITADHGNAEELIGIRSGQMDKEHSTNPVPFILIGKDWEEKKEESVDLSLISPSGALADVAPTILKLMNIPQPKEMNGTSLI